MSDKLNILIFAGIWTSSLLRAVKFTGLKGKVFIARKNSDNALQEYNNIEFFNWEDKTLSELGKLALENDINLVIVFNSILESLGAVNYFKYNLKIPTVGITRYWHQLETSKKFGKEFMDKYKLNTSLYRIIDNIKDLKNTIQNFGLPLVIKDDRMQAGFGTYICRTEKECFKTAKRLLKENKFFIAEKFILGEEVTLQVIWNGKKLIPLETVRDYKRLKDNNEGINTGSMGCYLPVKLSDKKRKMMNDYIARLEQVFIELKPNFTGIFALDLIFTEDEVYNLEFNMRPCTPEFETFIEHINNDIIKVLYDIANSNDINFEYKPGITGCVNVFHKGYEKHLDKIVKGKIKINKDFLSDSENLKINTDAGFINDNTIEAGLNVRIFEVISNDINNPFPHIYKYLEKITNKKLFYRKDIGQ